MTMIQIRARHYFLFLYTLFIVYGSLFPLVDWRSPELDVLQIWLQALGHHISRSDLLTNVLVYIPFGLLLCSVCSPQSSAFRRTLLTVVSGLILSCFLEYVQLFLPSRTSSPVDVALNTVSSLLGAVLFNWFGKQSGVGALFGEWRHRHFNSGTVVDIGLLSIFMWGAAQLAPFVPSLDLGDLKNGLKPLWQTLHDLSRFNIYRSVTYALNICSLGAVVLLILKQRGRATFWSGLYCGMILLVKVSIPGRQLSLEALAGLVFGVIMTIALQRLPSTVIRTLGFFSIACAFIVEELRPDVTTVDLHVFNWVPFGSQMAENVSGIGTILDGLWPFVVMGFFTVVNMSRGKIPNIISFGVFLAGCVLALEYAQTGIPGRYPDITPVLLSVVGWSVPFLFRNKNNN